MAKGKALEAGFRFWPGPEQKTGDEIKATFKKLELVTFNGQEKPHAIFDTEDGEIHISAGQMAKVYAPKMTPGTTYWITLRDKKKVSGKPQPAWQFQVNEDDGN